MRRRHVGGVCALGVLASVVLGGGVARANLLVNGSFEADDASAAPYYLRYSLPPAGPTGWTTFGDGVDLIHNTYTQGPSVLVDAKDGVQFVDLNAAGLFGGLRQTVSVVPGTEYALSAWFAKWATNSGGVARVSLIDPAVTEPLAFTDVNLNATSGWVERSITAVATSNTMIVQIQTVAVVQAAPGLDHVTLTAVPEPAAATLLAAPAGWLARRRRR